MDGVIDNDESVGAGVLGAVAPDDDEEREKDGGKSEPGMHDWNPVGPFYEWERMPFPDS